MVSAAFDISVVHQSSFPRNCETKRFCIKPQFLQSIKNPENPTTSPHCNTPINCNSIHIHSIYIYIHTYIQYIDTPSPQAPPHTRFEEMLQRAEAAGPHRQSRPAQQVLLRAPAVFTLSLVWDSPRATKEAITGAMRAVQPTVDLRGIFALGPKASPAGPYRLRCLVCYVGHHYLSYALSEELHQWLLLDDTVIKLVGGWEEVLETIVRESHQPSVLFYEAA